MSDEHKPLFMVREEDGGAEWLSDRPDWYPFSRPAESTDITAESLAEMMDQDAENANAHQFVGCHRGLAVLLEQHLGGVRATVIIRRIADLGGMRAIGRTNR